MMETEDIVAHVRSWSLDRAADMTVPKGDARAILAEFYEWIEPETSELEIVSIDEISEEEYDSFVDGIERA